MVEENVTDSTEKGAETIPSEGPQDTPETQSDDTTPPVEEAIIEYDGEKFTSTQIQEALKVQQNQADFTTKNQNEAQRLNIMAKVIEEQRQGLTNQPVGTQPSQSSQGANPPQMTAEKLQELFLGDNPSEAMAYFDNLVQSKINENSTQHDAKTAFMTAHPDFLQTINSPEYKTYMAQSPLGNYLNDVNGFLTYKLSTTGNGLKDAETKGFKNGEETALAHAKAKSDLKILNSGGGVTLPSKTQITADTSSADVENAALASIIAGRANK